MQVLRFEPGQPARATDARADDGSAGVVWLDMTRAEPGWVEISESWLGVRLHEQHQQDCLNERHPPYYDRSDRYELLIVRAMCPGCPEDLPETRPIVFIVSGKLVLTIHSPDDPVFDTLREALLGSLQSPPDSASRLLYLLLDAVVDGLLENREAITEVISGWQDRLLDRNAEVSDWESLVTLRSTLRRMETVAETQIDALNELRENTSLAMDRSLTIRFNDLNEHMRRLYNQNRHLQQDIDMLLQIYFSATTQRTNDILQFLAVVSAIFLPLNLLAGVFGMNFANLPLLHDDSGPLVVTIAMLAVTAVLLVWFRKRRWV